MDKLLPCPFCGDEARISEREQRNYDGLYKLVTKAERYRVACRRCSCGTDWLYYEDDAIAAWNKRTKIEASLYDQEETIEDCTVQILTNSVTGEESVGWRRGK